MMRKLRPFALAASASVAFALAAELSAATEAKVSIRAAEGKETIHRNIYGHFSEHLGRCIYEGYWVGEGSPIPNVRGIRQDVVQALRKIKIPVLRWPGGCFADEYHWMDGIGPRSERPTMINTHWGKVTETNHFGTHEFLDLCEQLGCEPYICGNVGSGTVRELQAWVEYVTFDGVSPMADLRRKNGRDEPWKVRYWGVGNENWGCGGNMRPEFYADLYRQFATYIRDFGGNRTFKVACGPNGHDVRWTEVLLREVGRRMHGLALHYYCGSGKRPRRATEFTLEDWYAQMRRALEIDAIIEKHAAVMDRYDPENRVALIVDEWGAWHVVEQGTNPGFLYQQNTIHDALVAAVTLHAFHKHCRRVKMANIAQTVNVLQAMILTDGARSIVTPTYHVFEMYVPHHDATMLPVDVECATVGPEADRIPALSASASRAADGRIHLSLACLDPERGVEASCELIGGTARRVSGRILAADDLNAHNTFERPEAVKPEPFSGASLDGGRLKVSLPPKSVAILEIE